MACRAGLQVALLQLRVPRVVDCFPTLPGTVVPVCLRTLVLRDATPYLVGRLHARHRCAV